MLESAGCPLRRDFAGRVCVVGVGGRGRRLVCVVVLYLFNPLGFQARARATAFASLACLVLSVRWLHVRTPDTIAQAVRVSKPIVHRTTAREPTPNVLGIYTCRN